MSYVELGKQINALDFGQVFRIEGGAVIVRPDEYAPEVYHDDDTDVMILTMDGARWQCLTGMTNQDHYNGAVMHSSEFIGAGIAELLDERSRDAAEDGDIVMFVAVVVEVLPDSGDDTDDDTGSGETDVAGWAIAYKELAGEPNNG